MTSAGHSESRHPLRALRGVDREILIVYALLVLLSVVIAAQSPAFRTSEGMLGVLKQSTFLSLVAVGQFAVILGRGIDLSVGSVAKLSALLSASVMAGRDDRVLPALGVAIGVGVVVGLFNAVVITKLNVAPFVATFASYYIVRGLAYSYSTEPVGQTSPMLYEFYTVLFFGVDAINVLLIIFWIITAWSFNRLAVARHLYAVGGNEDAARLAGVRVNLVRGASYVLCSVLAALAGVFDLMRSGVGGPTTGEGLELLVITAVVVGGASLMGGRGKVIGVLGGVLLLQVITATFDYLQLDSLYQQLVRGMLIILAVAVYRQRKAT